MDSFRQLQAQLGSSNAIARHLRPMLSLTENMRRLHGRISLPSAQHMLAQTDIARGGALAGLLRQDEERRRKFEALGSLVQNTSALARLASARAPSTSALATLRESPFHREATRVAELAASMRLPDSLERHRLSVAALSDRLALGGLTRSFGIERWRDPALLSAFNGASAMSQALAGIGVIDGGVRGAIQSLATSSIPGFLGLRDYRGLLDAAGLRLPRWPRFRRLTEKEKAERHRERLARHRQPRHVAMAKSLVHQYEAYLREAIREMMELEYGEAWPEERLPLCGESGRQLLSRWRKRGGDLFDHADYPHYAAIMAHPEHFQAVFAMGFGETATVEDLVGRARQLRAASHHPGHDFTPEDLRDLRVTWNAISRALRTLEAGLEIVWDH